MLRDYPAAQLLRRSEPYAFQRNRHRLGGAPRPAQPSTYQPNRLSAPQGWGQKTQEYWNSVSATYLKRRKMMSSSTNLKLGGLK